MILMGDRSTEERHKPITEELIDGAFVPMHLTESEFEEPVQQGMHVLGSDTLRDGSGIGKIAEQHRHLFPFAFQSTSQGQNFLGKVFGCVGKRLAFMFGGWKG